jgi:uncharacterized membrane protein HdeD (DUF308 family)
MKVANHSLSVAHRGLLAVVFALLTLLGPHKSLAWFAPLMLFYAMADGLLAIAAAARGAYARERWACFLVEGLIGVSGIVVIAIWPEANFAELTWTLTGWAIVTAIAALVHSAAEEKRVTREWLLASAGVVLVRFAVLAFGAMRAYEFTIAFSAFTSGLFFAIVFLAKIVRLLLERRGQGAGAHLHLFARS